MTQALKQLKAELKRGSEMFPVFLLEGEDSAGIEEGIRLIESAIDGEKVVFSGFEHSLERVLEAAESVPLFASSGRQLVIVRHAEGYQSRRSTSTPFAANERELGRLRKYLESPHRNTVLVFVYSSAPPRPSKKKTDFYTTVSAGAQTFRFDLPKTEREAFFWTSSLIKRYKLNATAEVIGAIVEACGTDTSQLKNAVEQLFLYLGAQENVSIPVEAVETVVVHTKLKSIYALQDAISVGDLGQALSYAREILKQKDFDPLRALVWITARVRELYRLSLRLASGETPQKILQTEKRRSWLVEKLLRFARRKSPQEWQQALKRLYAAEVSMKSSPISNEVALEAAIAEVCSLLSSQSTNRIQK